MISLITKPLEVWGWVEPLLSKVANKGGFTSDSILTDVQMGQAQLWNVKDLAVIVTRITQRPLERVLWVEWLAGERMDEWLEDWEKVQNDFAKSNGCTAVEFQGRKGWHKFNKAYEDYRPLATIFRREL